MTSRRIRFFAKPDEFESLLAQLGDELSLSFAVERSGQRQGFELVSLRDAMSRDWWRFYIAAQDVVLPIDTEDLTPARYGLVTCDRPRFCEEALLLGELSSRSDWADEAGESHENTAGHALLAKLRKRVRKHANLAVAVRNINLGGDAVRAKGIGCSESAVSWSGQGGKLKQWGVENIEFVPILE